MTSESRTIRIDPSLLKPSAKTRRSKPANSVSSSSLTSLPNVSSNVLKRKLVAKLRQHQKNITKNLAPPLNKDEEFSASLEYLQLLKKQKEENTRRNLLETTSKTLKQLPKEATSTIAIHQELPEDLKMNNNSFLSSTPISTDVPYGVMKNGTKPTYREWLHQTRKRQPFLPVETEQEKKLAELKNKIRKNAIEPTIVTSTSSSTALLPVTLASNNNETIVVPLPFQIVGNNMNNNMNNNNINNNIHMKNNNETEIENKTLPSISPPPFPQELRQITPTPPKIHQTFKRIKRINIGKQENDHSVRVLLKNDYTRKQVMNAQQLLSKKPLQEIKEYLKEHNLIKVGTTAPPDVLRKMYESAMLTGEVTNNNKENLIHNFLSEK